MEILEAYCEDLGRVVEIYEAQEAYFAQPEGARKRFRFRCSDPACRAENNPLVVGANYHRDAEESEKFQQPHFKSHDKHPHIGTCIWVLGEVRRREQSRDDGDVAEDPKTRRARSKATNVVDVFEPRHSDALLSATSATVRRPTTVAGDPAPSDKGTAGERTGTTTTPYLEKLIDCWSNLEVDERRSRRIMISGQTLNYQQLCLHVTQLRKSENGGRVVYGGARVKAWPPAAPTHYFLDFMDGCDRLADAAGEKSLTISLSIERLKNSRRGALLSHRIEQAMRPQHYLQVFAWGEIVKRARGKGFEIKLTALESLVLKVIESKGRRSQIAATQGALEVAREDALRRARSSSANAPLPASRPTPVPLAPAASASPRGVVRTIPLAPVSLAPQARIGHPAHTPPQTVPMQASPYRAAPLVTASAVPSTSMVNPPAAKQPAVDGSAVGSRDVSQGFLRRLSAWWRSRR